MDERRLGAFIVLGMMAAVFIAGIIKDSALTGFLAALGIVVVLFFLFCLALLIFAWGLIATFTPEGEDGEEGEELGRSVIASVVATGEGVRLR